MPRSDKNTLSGLWVRHAMRRQVVQLEEGTPISNGINKLIKYKVNAVLTTDRSGEPLGVLSKTDVMGAFYAGLPTDASVADIMSRPPLFCSEDDTLDNALKIMNSKRIYRLYVTDPSTQKVIGTIAYPDIVGLLYKYCHDCEYSHYRKSKMNGLDPVKRYAVKDVMTKGVQSVYEDDSLLQAMEKLSEYRFGAILVKERNRTPCGVVSKTDLALAYKHGIDSVAPAKTIMSSPVESCGADDLLETAIKKMIFSDVHRLFVYQADPADLVGVISLSDAARIRSGSCHACISSRINLDAV